VGIIPVNDAGSNRRCPPSCRAPATYVDKTTDYVCKSCPANCATCDHDTTKTDNVKCLTVNKGFFLSADRASPCSANFDSCTSSTVGTCKAGFYLTAAGACVSCETATPGCVSCAAGTGRCTSCKPGGSLTKDAKCLPNCSRNPRTFPNPTTYTCDNCMANCL